MKDLTRLIRYVRPYLPRLVIAGLCLMVASVMILGLVSLTEPLINDVLRLAPQDAPADGEPKGKLDALGAVDGLMGGADWITRFSSRARELAAEGQSITFLSMAVVMVVLFFIQGLFAYFGSYYAQSVGHWVLADLRNELFSHIHRQSLAFFSAHQTGLLMSRILGDINVLRRVFSTGMAEAIRLVFIVVGQAAFLFYLNWKLAALCLFGLPVIVYPLVRFGRKMKTASRRSQEKRADLSNILKETIVGSRVVQAFGMERYELARFARGVKQLVKQQLRAARIMALTAPLLQFVGAIAGALLLAYGGSQIARGDLNPGEFSTFVVALAWMYSSLKSLARINNQLQQSLAGAQRVFQMLDTDMRVPEKPGAQALAPFRSEIEYRNVSFRYSDRPILQGVNLKVPAGQVVAIVGSSGAGKTTLVNLLPRFLDMDGGAITVDGVDIRDVTLASLRQQIGIVTQDVILFDDTVRNNIAYGRDDLPAHLIEDAAKAAFAHDFIGKLKHGYDTSLGEAGHQLSAGERQRLSIARALLKDSPILILDEATSSLDTESEAMVQNALNNLMQNRTVFVIAHRLSTVRNADLIIVMDRGKIVERGVHDELLRMGGTYARLHDMQFRDAPADQTGSGPAAGTEEAVTPGSEDVSE
jgi:subfamily B ATP-binding cassette protein MsbA